MENECLTCDSFLAWSATTSRNNLRDAVGLAAHWNGYYKMEAGLKESAKVVSLRVKISVLSFKL